MTSFSLTQLSNKSGEVTEAAFSGPVTITDRGKRKFVLLTAAEYDRLTASDQRRAVHVDELSEAEAQRYIDGLGSDG